MLFAAGFIVPLPRSMKLLGRLPRRVGEIETCWMTLSNGHHLVVSMASRQNRGRSGAAILEYPPHGEIAGAVQ